MIKVVLLPQWVEEALKAANLPMSTALDTFKLADTLSNEDVAIYIDMNMRAVYDMFRPVMTTLLPHSMFPEWVEESVDPVKYNKGRKIRKQYEDYQLAHPKSPAYNAVSMLPPHQQEGRSTIQALGNNYEDYTFDIEYVEGVLLIKPILLQEGIPAFEQQITAYDKLLSFLTVHQSFEAVAKTEVFKHYTYLLKIRNAS